MGDRKLRNILEGIPEDGCKHRNIVPEADPNWGYCPDCGEDSFPLTAEAAGMSDETVGCGTFGANQLPSSPVEPGLSAARIIVDLDRKIASLETANNCLTYANKQLAEQHDKATRECFEALADCDRLRQDRADALNVKTKDGGLTASEWIARTGKAERERDEARARIAELEAEVERLCELRQKGCECGDDEACRFARERDEARAEVQRCYDCCGYRGCCGRDNTWVQTAAADTPPKPDAGG